MTGVTERAILAGGCFWGMQDLLRRFPGVISTRVGYSGGDVPNATYCNHGTHAEAIEIIFEPEKTSFRDLLEFFFQIHDPTTKNRQGNDIGLSYRSAIFYTSDEQRRVAEGTTPDVDKWRVPGDRARPQDLDEGAFIMIGPRDVFTSQDEVFMSASSAAPISPRVRRLRTSARTALNVDSAHDCCRHVPLAGIAIPDRGPTFS